MRNTKEIITLLAAIFAVNRTSAHEDKDITAILSYAFHRVYGSNTNLLVLSCIGKSKEQILPEVDDMLREETKFHDYIVKMEEKQHGTKKSNGKAPQLRRRRTGSNDY